MAGNKIARYLSGRAVQGGADAFKELAITTNLDPANGYAYEIKKIEFCYENFAFVAANFQELDVVLSRDTKAAIPELSDTDVMYKFHKELGFATAVGFYDLSLAWEYVPTGGMYIVEPTIYLQIDSAATAAVRRGCQERRGS